MGRGVAVADVLHSGCGWGVFDEDLAFQVGDGDVAEDLLETLSPVDHVLDPVQVEQAVAGQLLDDGVGGRSAGSGAGADGRGADGARAIGRSDRHRTSGNGRAYGADGLLVDGMGGLDFAGLALRGVRDAIRGAWWGVGGWMRVRPGADCRGRPGADCRERLAGDLMLDAQSRDRSGWRVVGTTE